MTIIFFWNVKNFVQFPEMEEKNFLKKFAFKDICIWIRDDKFSQSGTGYLPLAVNVLRNNPKI